MSKKNEPRYADALMLQQRQEKAIKQAREHLAGKGISYPIYDSRLTQQENYAALLSYSEQEAALVVQYMRAPSGERPLVLDTTASGKKGWQGYND